MSTEQPKTKPCERCNEQMTNLDLVVCWDCFEKDGGCPGLDEREYCPDGKLREPVETPKPDETDWKKIALVLAGKVNMAIGHLKAQGPGLMLNTDTMEVRHWKDDFADALELIPGLTINREALHATKKPKKKKTNG